MVSEFTKSMLEKKFIIEYEFIKHKDIMINSIDKNIEALAPYVREIVTKMAEDIKRVRLNINT